MNGLQGLSNDLAAAVERAGRAVFSVAGRARLGSTGVHWRPGLVVTADHTVHVDEEVTITGPDGRALAARVAGRDPTIDVAVLKVDAPGVPVAEIADSSAVRVGHIVLALGAGPRASWGVVSSLGEGRMLHLDLTLYPGFSGGALVDARGRIVGVNTSGPRSMVLAIPISTVNRVVGQLLEKGRIARGYLGLGMQPVRLPDTITRTLNLPGNGGVIVVAVEPDSPAEKAGVLIGDVLIALDDKSIGDTADVLALLGPERVGSAVRASIVRGGRLAELTISVGERPRREG